MFSRRALLKSSLLFLAAAALVADAPQPLVERILLENINATRAAQRLPPLEIDPELSAFARQRVDEVLKPGGSDVPIVGEALHRRAREFGYDARFLAELILEAEDDDLAAIEAAWGEGSPGRPLVLRDDLQDLGVGIGRRENTRGYVFLFGRSGRRAYEERTRLLPELGAAPSEILARVNELRRSAGARPLRLDPRLAQAAQRHAEDMLARDYYGHRDPENRGPEQRALSAGYRPSAIGENLARGIYSIPEVLQEWMGSPGHRRQMLDDSFRDVGFGVARGRVGNQYRMYWVQLFGREK